jgi:hypothetical protein
MQDFVWSEGIINALSSLWSKQNQTQFLNIKLSKSLKVYFFTKWLKSKFLVKALCRKDYRLLSPENNGRALGTSKN